MCFFDAFFCKKIAKWSIWDSVMGKSKIANGLSIFLIRSSGTINFFGLAGRFPLQKCTLGTILIGVNGITTADF